MIKICGLFVLGFSLLLMSCSEADTLGDEPPDEIVIESVLSNSSLGIGIVIGIIIGVAIGIVFVLIIRQKSSK